MKTQVTIFWFRRDLRIEDNIGLLKALQTPYPVLPIFIFDSNILEKLPENDARVTFIFETLQKLKLLLQSSYDSSIAIYYGKPEMIFKKLISEYQIYQVHTNRDYEPYAIKRDTHIKNILKQNQVELYTHKDQVIFEKNEIVKQDGNPYVVYTPYKNKWKTTYHELKTEIAPTTSYLQNLIHEKNLPNITLDQIGFIPSIIKVSQYNISQHCLDNYKNTRDFPAIKKGTSRLGPHLRFGTIGIRTVLNQISHEKNEVFWSELIWREFFAQILWHYPHTTHSSFKPKYDRIEWRNNEKEFQKWMKGETGYPLVDAGMRQLNQTGYMHNRVRMVVASFLCKHLLIDWRWGETYFAEKLLDYDLSANIGNWQWAAGSGVDAAPYFRIFNPTTQITKFDKQHEYINTWVKDLNELSYPQPVVDHKMARERCLGVYKKAVS